MNTAMRKIVGDIAATPGRFAMMIIAIALSSATLIAMLLAYQLLTRDMHRNYADTQPAAAELIIDSTDAFQQAENIISIAKKTPTVIAAEIAGRQYFNVEVSPGKVVTALIFVVPDVATIQINKMRLDKGQWPATNEIILERKALKFAQLSPGDELKLVGREGKIHNLKISGAVHDPALAPADTEHIIYGYMSRTTFDTLGESLSSNYLKIAVAPAFMDSQTTTKIAATIAKNIPFKVSELHIPPPSQHPHQAQMTTGLNLLLLFSFLAVLLGEILMATTLWGMLAQQVRQIGIMKTLGASSGQISRLYLLLVAGIGTAALCLGLPLGIMAGHGLTTMAADLLNLNIYDKSLPLSLWFFIVIFCVGLPMLLAFFPFILLRKKVSVPHLMIMVMEKLQQNIS